MQMHGPLCHPYGIRGYGNPDDGVAIVGIAPGRNEIEQSKRPFTGASGDLLNKLLSFSGWSRDRVYCTNTICWWNNKPTEHEIEECNPRFIRELKELQPHLKVIITAGEIANSTVMGMKRRKGSRGSVVWSDYWGCYILDTHHPSAVLQAQSMPFAQDIIRDLSKIPDIIKYPPNGALANVRYSVVDSVAHGQQVLDTLPLDGSVAIDIETSNPDDETIDSFTDKLLCFSITRSSTSTGKPWTYVFPTRIFPDCVRDGTHARHTGGSCPCGLSPTVFRWPLDAQWLYQAGHNDIIGLFNYFGVRLPLVNDTMLLSMCSDERPGYHGLKGLAREYLTAGWYNTKVKPFYKGKMHLLKPEDVEEYNAKDSQYTYQLEPILRRRAEADEMMGLYHNLLLPATSTFIDMQIRGINIDQKRLAQLAYLDWFPRYLAMFRDLQLEAHDIGWPTDDINFNSTPQLRKLFYDIMGVEPTKYTPKGKPSLDKETLDKMDHPFAAKIRAFRTLDGTIDYVFAVQKHTKYDGLLHPTGYISTTRTGRTAYRDPAMQTIPKDYTVGADYARLREIIIPHNPDTHVIVECDFSQIEVWIAWAESRDPTLLEHLQSGDVHSYTAEIAFDTRRELWDKLKWLEKRQNAKKIRFGLQYGEGAEKLSTPPPIGIGCTVGEARKFVNNFWSGYPVYKRWFDGIQRQAREQGYLRNPNGRVMRFPLIMDHKELRQAVNFKIQAPATDINLACMIELVPLLRPLDSYIILNIHDNLTFEVNKRYLQEALAIIKRVMTKRRFPGYPEIPVEIKIGPNMGQVERVEV